MTLCNTFRLFALTIVLSVIDTPANSFTISRTSDANENIDHLEQAESISLQVRDDFRRPNDISVIKGDRLDPTTHSEIKDALTTIDSGNSFEILSDVDVTTQEFSNLGTTDISDNKVNNGLSTRSGERKSNDDLETTENRQNEETTIPTVGAANDEVDHSKYEKYEQISQNVNSKEQTLPSWKKYTNINRKSSIETHDDFAKAKNRSEEMMTDETGTPVQDTKTGDIPSLNQIKNFLSFFKSDAQNDTKSSKEVTGQDSNGPPTDKETPATVESKRGGFLDFSLKSLFEDNDDKKDTSQETGTSRPKNRKLSWRIGSRYRAKDENSAEKQGRSRFRLRNDDDKNKKEKSDIKTIKESQEEKTKEVESREESQKDNSRNRGRDRENKKEERKNTQDSREVTNNIEIVNVIKTESKDTPETTTIDTRNDKEILKEWRDYDRRQEPNQKKNDNDSKEKKDRNRNDKEYTSSEQSRSRQRNDKETSKERTRDSDTRDRSRERQSERKSYEVNIWKTESSEDQSRSRSRSDKDSDKKNRQDQNQNRKEERNRGDNTERQRNNDKTEEKMRSRSRVDKESSRENNENREESNQSKSNNNNNRNNNSRSRSRNDEENSRERFKTDSRNNENRDDTSRSTSRNNNESRSRVRDDERNSKERLNESRNKNNKNIDERNRSNAKSNNDNERNNESRSTSRNYEEDSRGRSKTESRNENRDEKSRSNGRNNNDRNNESRLRSRDDDRNSRERSYIDSRKESSENRDDSRKNEEIDIVSTKALYDTKIDRRQKDESSASGYNTEKQRNEEIKSNIHIEAENVEQNNNLPIPRLDEITKKLSTIDEEDEPESEVPTLLEDKITTSKPEYTEVQNIVAAKYPTDFKFTDMDTKQGSFEPKEPNKVTTTVAPSRTTQKTKEFTTNENLEFKSKQENAINRGRITFKETVDLRGSIFEGNQYTESIPDIETELKKETTTRPSVVADKQQELGSGNKDVSDLKNVKETEAIVQMNEDAIKEELMKEEVINNYEENMGRYKGASETTTQTTIPVRIYEVTKPFNVNDKSVDEKLSVKPLSILEKLKTTILFPVSSNYKPPKKIDVQPPKTFVRDPDDNSWRNESLSSLGIVFNPKNSSKPLTQVLKNKTETELNNLSEKNNKNETPDLRERLEKIAEMRKTKKKKTDAYGNVMYNDYEENSKENTLSKENEMLDRLTTPPIKPTSRLTTKITTTTPVPTTPTTTTPQPTTAQIAHTDVTQTTSKPLTHKPKKIFNVAEYYDTSDEDDADYLRLAKLDLKKHTLALNKEIVTPPTWPITNNRVVHNKNDDRKPTLQYFPPLTTQKVTYNTDYNNDFNNKMKAYTYTEPPTNVLPVSYTKKTTAKPRIQHDPVFTPDFKSILDTPLTTKPIEFDKDFFMTPAPGVTVSREPFTFVTDDGSFNKASDVIKHYRDFLHAVAKDHEEDKNAGYAPYTQVPAAEVTGVTPYTKPFVKPDLSENYDYDTDYKKDALQRFVHNFNHHNDRFKVNLPLLYNNSIIHGAVSGEYGRDVASSRAYLSKLESRPRDCDNSTVELSPAYELHYYVPEQEEKEVADPKPVTIPYQYHL